jgi:16S rRNA (cytosine967-C5)-methyltransferase
VYGTLRMRRSCDWLVDQFARGELEPVVLAALRAGAYQLAFMRVPSHAAVWATVSETPERARGLVNAVLRRIAALVAGGPPRWPDLPTKLSYPDWVIQQLSADLGPGRALEALKQMNQAASAAVRPDGYIQDPGSQAVGSYFAAVLVGGMGEGDGQQPGAAPGLGAGAAGTVLDMCAAPGGKATALAQGSRLVVAVDLSPVRARVVARNATQLGLDNLPVVVADGTQPPFRPGSFAGVLVDAPCSGLGVLRRRPDARWRVCPDDVERLVALQRRLLEAAAALVARGGLLGYSVCTMTKAETAGVDAWLGELLPAWTALEPPAAPWEPLGRGALLLPQTAGTDGMYLLVLRRP